MGTSDGSTFLGRLRVGSLLLDEDEKVVLVAPAVGELLAWSSEELLGSRFAEYAEGEEPLGAMRAAAARGDAWRGPVRLRGGDGHARELTLHSSPLFGAEERRYLIATLLDPHLLRSLEQRLAGLDALFERSPVGIALFDTEQRYVHVNEALARLNGRSIEEHLGKTVYEVLPTMVADSVDLMQRTVLHTGRPLLDVSVPTPDGSSRSISYNRLTDSVGKVIGFSALVMDNSSRRQALHKVERARERLALLDDLGVALGEHLDIRSIAQNLAATLVPRFADHADVLLRGEVLRGAELPRPGRTYVDPLRHVGSVSRVPGRYGEAEEDAFRIDPRSVLGSVLEGGRGRVLDNAQELADLVGSGSSELGTARDPSVHSALVLPLVARGFVLGLLILGRADGSDHFDRDDLALATEVGGRSGASLDNARLYARERDGALKLQRSLLPPNLPVPVGVHVATSYVPAGQGDEIGGDWFDVIPLSGGRVAFVIGDVMGHGLGAAATMGRLRTAVRTLAGLDLPPDELLRRVGELSDDLAESNADPPMATCIYAIYEPAPTIAPHLAPGTGSGVHRRGLLTLANAGHLPPLLMQETSAGERTVRELRLPSGAPLTVGLVPFETVEVEVAEGTVLVLYTDGLIEDRTRPISEGMTRLRAQVRATAEELGEELTIAPGGALEALCTRVIDGLGRGLDSGGEYNADDVALLAARLGGLPADTAVAWNFAPEERSARRARREVCQTLRDWHLGELEDTALLLVSELVTNSLRYAGGAVGLRMVRGEGSLVVEVADTGQDVPSERTAALDDESGRGIQLVAGAAHRWGTRRGPEGKTVWFELLSP